MNTRLKFLSGSYFEVANQLNCELYKSVNHVDMSHKEYLHFLEIDIPRTTVIGEPHECKQAVKLLQAIPNGRLFYSQGDFDGGSFTEALFAISNLYQSYNDDEQSDLIDLNKRGAIRAAYLNDNKEICALSIRFVKSIVDDREGKSLFQMVIIRNSAQNIKERNVTLISHPLMLPVGACANGELGLKDIEKVFKEKLNSNRLYAIFQSLLANGCYAYDLFHDDFENIKKASPGLHNMDMAKLDRLGMISNAGFYLQLAELENKAIEMKGRGYASAAQTIEKVVEDLAEEKMKFIKGETGAQDFSKKCNAIINAAEATELKDHRDFFSKLFNGILKALAFLTCGLIKIIPTHSLFTLNKIKVITRDFSANSEINNKKGP